MTDKSTSSNARAVCCASTALIFKCLGLSLISLIEPLKPKLSFNLISPAASSNFNARAWFDTSFGIMTCAPSLTFLMFLLLNRYLTAPTQSYL